LIKKETTMKKLSCWGLLAGFLIGAAPAGASTGSYPSSPKELVENYLKLDADAAGLAPETWPELGQYTDFPQAPKWEAFVVIDRYEITKIMEGHTRAQVRVTYHPLGQLSDKFTTGTAPENVVFYLNKVKDQWKVDSPPLMPHVSFEVMKRRLNANSAANPKEKKVNDALIAQIEAARGQQP
jgi:hypothetical protein